MPGWILVVGVMGGLAAVVGGMALFAPLAFANPWILLAAAGLPALWWLLRVLPPLPRLIRFPPLRLLLGLEAEEETPRTTPPWLLLLRLMIAALVILAIADPLLNPRQSLPGSGPVILVVDDGWAAARDWSARQTAMVELAEQAEREARPMLLLPTAPPADGAPVATRGPLAADAARAVLEALQPKPWPTDRQAALQAAEQLEISGSAHVVWLNDGLDGAGAEALAERLQQLGQLTVIGEPPERLAHLLLPPESDGAEIIARARRATTAGPESLWLRAIASDGRLLTRTQLSFADGEAEGRIKLDLPLELRNSIARLQLDDESTAGGVILLDEGSRRRLVGLVTPGPVDIVQPLLNPLYYLDRALAPFAEVRYGDIASLLTESPAMLVFPDIAPDSAGDVNQLDQWMQRGGVVLRFAGPNLAREADSLVPVRLRQGGRTLSGALLWSEPTRLAPLQDPSPFAGLAVPDDVTIRRQVLAEPTIDLPEKSWARLVDGTPLVTADHRGDGWLVLVHTTADTAWSNLPLSGLFVQMLQRLVQLGRGTGGAPGGPPLPPIETLDGFGRLVTPPATVGAVPSGDDATASPQTPPGYYGRDSVRRAVNLAPAVASLEPLGALPDGVLQRSFAKAQEFAFKPWLLTAALLLFLADVLVSLHVRGYPLLGARRGVATATLLLALACGPLTADPARAQSAADGNDDAFALDASLKFRFAFVLTGVPEVDEVSRAGLSGLSRVLRRRTSVEPAEPIGVDVEVDELAFFPLLYWPLHPQQLPLTEDAVQRLNAFMRDGGTLFLDTRDGDSGGGSASALFQIAPGLHLPDLLPVPRDHVLTKAFYLLQDFPGRWAGGTLWVEQLGDRINDGVASIIVGPNNYAAAWAADEIGRPLYPAVPGGELQREMSYRFGVNLTMYALTGNYKADQVHVPAILERLGQ
jgi:hypothetical protein